MDKWYYCQRINPRFVGPGVYHDGYSAPVGPFKSYNEADAAAFAAGLRQGDREIHLEDYPPKEEMMAGAGSKPKYSRLGERRGPG